MTSIQTTISFNVQKKCSFYGNKHTITKEDFTNATIRDSSYKYTPTVKKVITLSSSESESDSDSDIENIIKNNINVHDNTISIQTPQHIKKSNESDGM